MAVKVSVMVTASPINHFELPRAFADLFGTDLALSIRKEHEPSLKPMTLMSLPASLMR
jgi:hypothetical protein